MEDYYPLLLVLPSELNVDDIIGNEKNNFVVFDKLERKIALYNMSYIELMNGMINYLLSNFNITARCELEDTKYLKKLNRRELKELTDSIISEIKNHQVVKDFKYFDVYLHSNYRLLIKVSDGFFSYIAQNKENLKEFLLTVLSVLYNNNRESSYIFKNTLYILMKTMSENYHHDFVKMSFFGLIDQLNSD